jgi:Stage II sporulation protein E (SpoIIE)
VDAVIGGHPAAVAWPDLGVPVECDEDIGRVQRLASSAAVRQGFSTAGAQLVERLATDMATHLVRHQEAGRMLVRFADWDERHGVELLLSTANSGTPFEVDLRDGVLVSDLFEVYTVPGKGTVMMAQLWRGPQTGPSDRRFSVGSMSDPIEGEVVSGDAWAVEQRGARLVVLVADGLGHGVEAAAASAAAVTAFRAHHLEPVERIAACLHTDLRRTRGAAIALAEIDRDAAELRFCGIGNISARLLTTDGVNELVSHYGIAGYQTQHIRTFTMPWSDDAMLVMHSDGLSSRWDADAYPDLRLQHPQLAASTVMRDATRANDDALITAVRGIAELGSRRSETD